MAVVLLAFLAVLACAGAVIAVRYANAASARAGDLLEAALHADEEANTLSADRDASWLQSVTLERVHVCTTLSQTFVGCLDRVTADGVVLRAAELLGGEKPVMLAGEVWIPRAQVAFVQRGT